MMFSVNDNLRFLTFLFPVQSIILPLFITIFIILLLKQYFNNLHIVIIIIIIIRMFCPRAGLPQQIQESWLQFCPKAGLPLQIQESRLKFY